MSDNVKLDPARLVQDGQELYGIAQSLDTAISVLSNSLGGSAGMAGDDNAAEEFCQGSEGYDALAGPTIDGVRSFSNSLRLVDAALNNTARAYDAAQKPGAGLDPKSASPQPETAHFDEAKANPPSALGAGWPGALGEFQELIEWGLQQVGVVIPTGDEDKLQSASEAWGDFAQSIRTARSQVSSSLTSVGAMTFPQSAKVLSCRNSISSGLQSMETNANGMRDWISDFRTQLRNMREELGWFLKQMAIEIAAELAIGGLLTVVTAGIGAIATAAKVGTTVVRWCIKIAKLIDRLKDFLRGIRGVKGALVRGGLRAAKEGLQAGLASAIATTSVNAARADEKDYQAQDVGTAFISAFAGGAVASPASRLLGGSGGPGIKAGTRQIAGETGAGAIDGLASAAVESGMTGGEFNPISAMVLGSLMGGGFTAVGRGISAVRGGDSGSPAGPGVANPGANGSADGTPTPGTGTPSSNSNGTGGTSVDTDSSGIPTPGSGDGGSNGAGDGSPIDLGDGGPTPGGSADGGSPDAGTPSAPDAPSTPDAGTPSSPDAPSTPDAGTPDAPSTPDAGTPDAPSTPDAGTPDAPSTPDAGTPDAPSTPDAGTPDAPSTPDAGTPDAPSTPDAGTPDAPSTPDAGTPDAPSTPDAGTPDVATPDAGSADGATPEAHSDGAPQGAGTPVATTSTSNADAPDAPESAASDADGTDVDGTNLDPAADADAESSSDGVDLGDLSPEAATAMAGTGAAAAAAVLMRPTLPGSQAAGSSTSSGSATQSAAPDGSAPNGSTPDGTSPDGSSTGDGSTPDGTTPDGSAGSGADGGTPDADATPQQSTRTEAEIRQALAEINPNFDPHNPANGYATNCGNTSAILNDFLNGDSTSEAPTGTLDVPEMEARTGLPQTPMTPQQIADSLTAMGAGSHCVVGIDRSTGDGHWFNAYYDGTQVWSLDAQTGDMSPWPPNEPNATNWDASITPENVAPEAPAAPTTTSPTTAPAGSTADSGTSDGSTPDGDGSARSVYQGQATVEPDHASDGSQGAGTTFNGYKIPELTPEIRQQLADFAATTGSSIVRNPDGSYSLREPITVNSFEMTNANHDWAEFQRQVGLQQQGLNNLTIAEWRHNVNFYDSNKRVAPNEQKAEGKLLKANGVTMTSQAVLHGPDQVAGGRPDRFDANGSLGINSSMGRQWQDRIVELTDGVRDAAASVPKELRPHVRLTVQLGATDSVGGNPAATQATLNAARPVTAPGTGTATPATPASAPATSASATPASPTTRAGAGSGVTPTPGDGTADASAPDAATPASPAADTPAHPGDSSAESESSTTDPADAGVSPSQESSESADAEPATEPATEPAEVPASDDAAGADAAQSDAAALDAAEPDAVDLEAPETAEVAEPEAAEPEAAEPEAAEPEAAEPEAAEAAEAAEPQASAAEPASGDAAADATSSADDASTPDQPSVPETMFHPLLDAHFDRLDAPDAPELSVRLVNEMGLWADPGRFGNNCHYVVNALELRARGYDVIASPTVRSVVLNPQTGAYDNAFEFRYPAAITADWVQVDGTRRDFDNLSDFEGDTAAQALDALTSSWPEGGRGFIAGYWRDGGGHIFSVTRDADGVRLSDGQVNDADVSEYLGDMFFDERSSAPWKDITVIRVDDLVPTPEVLTTSTPRRQDEYQLLVDWGNNPAMPDRPQVMIDRERAANTRWQARNDELIAERVMIRDDPDADMADRQRAADEIWTLQDQNQRLAEGANRFELEVNPPAPAPPQTHPEPPATGSGEN